MKFFYSNSFFSRIATLLRYVWNVKIEQNQMNTQVLNQMK